MRAILDTSLFEQGRIQDLALLECFALARYGRHAILHHSDLTPQVEDWISTQSDNIQQDLNDVLNYSVRLSANMSEGVPTITIVAGGTSDWPLARLCIQDAARLLREPLHILLENSINDLSFLRRLAPTTHRSELDHALAQGWAIVDNAGGVDGIKSIINMLNKITDSSQGRFQRLRYWIMFDRDSDLEDRSKPAPKTENISAELKVPHPDDPWVITFYRLERRAIENYLPTQALRRLAADDYEKAACDALEHLRIDEKRHKISCQYNMKSGLLGDNKPLKKKLNDRRFILRKNLADLAQEIKKEDCDLFFRGIDDQARAALAYGFTDNIADCYANDQDPTFDRELQVEYDRGVHDTSREQILDRLLQNL